MTWSLLLLTLLSYCSGARSQPIMTQPSSASSSLGQTAKLSCTRSGGGTWSGYFHWYQQGSGQAPRFVLYGTSNRGDRIPDRFTGSSSGNVGYLSIANVQPEDQADYYCADWNGSVDKYIFGSGTQLSITGLDPAPPKLNVYPPSPEEIKTTNKATLVCLVQDFNPGTIQVDWLADGTKITQNVETSRPKKQGDKYISSSYLTLNRADWERQNCYKCRVTHEGKRYEEPVNPSQCSSP